MAQIILIYLKNHWLDVVAIVVATSSALIAYMTWNLSYLLTHRPYVWAENFGYLDQSNRIINPINKVMLKVINSPAETIYQEYSYYILGEENKETIEKDTPTNSIKYPSDKIQYTHAVSKVTRDLANGLKENEKLIRYIRIEYKWLSSDRKYFFEGEWEYNSKSEIWDIIYQEAN
ncbi:hypothetical protein KAI54_01100 [Candidatus Gracilibacteria bacterium]|nr:hypothetical protein [Candidatus Gracilibacteria bacterium]